MTAPATDDRLPSAEATRLRDLAFRQAEYAALPVMEERRRQWFDLNAGRTDARPPVVIETWTFDRDFLPDSLLECRSDAGRAIERQLLRHVRNHELIDDDTVIPDRFEVSWQVSIDEFGIPIPRRTVKDAEGVPIGYQEEHPLADLTRDLAKLRPARCSVDRDGTDRYRGLAESTIGDILPVVMRGQPDVTNFLTHRLMPLLGMESYFTAMYDTPDELHALMRYLRDNALSVMRWYESEGLLVLNNGNQDSFGSSYNFTDRLPAPGFDGTHVRLCDMWLSTNSQETVGISPEFFGEFCFPYYRDVCEPMGLLYYGCCEPVHPVWEYVSRLPHLKKVSISRWCDQRFMGDALRGTDVVFSRKPDPNFLSVDERLDEDAWAAHIRETLDATRGVHTEFIIRDVYTLHGNLDNARRAVALARREIDRAGRG